MKAMLREAGLASRRAATADRPAVRTPVIQPASASARICPVSLSWIRIAPSMPGRPRSGLRGLTMTDFTMVRSGASEVDSVVIM